ncbi:MAG: response regulator [Wenzhouxiangella sp.]|nr:MAG: response regulator [Wenzhouxiangella sp.]
MSDRTLLLVEDDPQDELLTLRALKSAGVCNHIDVVRDGQQALDYLFCQGEFSSRSGAVLPAVVLLDIGLPKISGLDVLARLREHPSTRHVPVVILTSSDEPIDLVRSYRNGANSFVRKPVQFAEFARTVARLGVYWMATNEPCRGA